MNRILFAAMAMAVAGVATAQSLQVSLGTRETNAGGGPDNGIGGNGGSLGGIEWLNLDGQTLNLDGTWQQFTFDMDTDALTAFAGSTANGVLDGNYGTIEHIRFRSNGDVPDGFQIRLWIDDVTNTIDSGPVNFGTFEGYADGTEVMFQEPEFSGSTAGNIVDGNSSAGVDSTMAHSGDASYNVIWEFEDNSSTTQWLRFTTFNALNQPNPIIRYDQNSVVSFWVKGEAVPEPATMIALGLGAAALIRRRKK